MFQQIELQARIEVAQGWRGRLRVYVTVISVIMLKTRHDRIVVWSEIIPQSVNRLSLRISIDDGSAVSGEIHGTDVQPGI